MKKKYKELSTTERIGLIAQVLLTFSLLVLLFITIGEPQIMEAVNIIMIMLFLVMGYNNHFIYKRKGFTLFNLIVALLLLIGKLFY